MKPYLLLFAMVVGLSGCAQVEDTERGLAKVWGKSDTNLLGPGLHFYNPFSTDVYVFSIVEQAWEGEQDCFTQDTQTVRIKFKAQLRPDLEQLRTQVIERGLDWESKIIPSALESSIKDAIGKIKADDLVSKREEARSFAIAQLRASLESRGVKVSNLDFTNLDFNDDYEKAVEAKVVAIQRAHESKNKTEQVKEEAIQIEKRAIAEANAMKIKTQALQQSKGLVEYEAIQRWNGALPNIMMGQSTPIINLSELTKGK